MAKKNETKVDFSKVAAHVIKTPLENFVEDSYLPYAHYVIMSRALISEDGLKPVQRRILYAMDQLGLTDKKGFMKAAQIVGETMGKYHPHGDSSIGDALARLGQTFSMRVPLIDVQGSVGFTTGDAPAAPRYWEGRPTSAAMELTREVKEGAAEMGVNYDGKYAEPVMLPIKWPNGIINGSQGIAVGYSSNVIPHNPTEVMDAIIAMVKNPEITIEEIMDIMPGPDFPTGGILVGYDGVKEYYETGKGTFSVRGKYVIEPGNRGTHKIIFSEAPYQVSAEQIVKAVEDGKKKKDKFKEVSFVKDLSDMDNGFRLSIGIKAGANPEVVLKDIFKWTPLESGFSANMNVLINGVPVVSTMKELLENFIEYRSERIVSKVEYKVKDLEKNIERLSGILAVLADIDKAIKIIRNADNSSEASSKLQKSFKINEEQSTYILSMPLRRLTKSDSLSIKKEVEELKKENKYLNTILDDEKEFNKYMINELEETKKIIGDERRTLISNKTEAQLKKEAEELKKAKERFAKNVNYYITLFNNGQITKTLDKYKQERSPTGIVVEVKAKAQDNLIFVCKNGNALRVPVSYVSENSLVDVSTTTGLPDGEVIGFGKESNEKDDHGILVVTSSGEVNVVSGGFPTSDNFKMTKLSQDEIVYSCWLTKQDLKNKNLVLVSSDGYVSNFSVEQVRTSNSGAGTVKGMILNDGAYIVGASVINPESAEIASASHQTVKLTNMADIPSRNRSAKGVILQRLSKNDELINAFASKKVVANKNDRSLNLPDITERALSGNKRNGSNIMFGHFEVE